MLNSIEPPWYVTRMPGGVTGKACEGLPMSIFIVKSERAVNRVVGNITRHLEGGLGLPVNKEKDQGNSY